MINDSSNISKEYDRAITTERCLLAQTALNKVELLISDLNEVTEKLNESWKSRKALTSELIISESPNHVLRKIAIIGLETEELLEKFRRIMVDISQHYNIAMTETGAILESALETYDNRIYLEGRKLLDCLVNIAIRFNGRRITGLRPEILVDTYAHFRIGAAATKYSSTKFLLKRLLNML